MDLKLKLVPGLAALAMAAAGGGLLALALDDDDDDEIPAIVVATTTPPVPTGRTASDAVDADDQPLSATEADRVTAAALRITGGGTITELDRSDDPGETYEVEVVKDGREIDLAFDASFRRVPNRRYEE